MPEFANLNPTAENIAVVIWNKLRPHISLNKQLEVTLYETPRNYVHYKGLGMLYPLFFKPISKERLWGGMKLMDFLNKPFHGNEIGESWELSAVSGDESVVSDGPLKGNNSMNLLRFTKPTSWESLFTNVLVMIFQF